MSEKSSNFLNMTVTLIIVTAVAAISLGFVFEVTKEPIAKARLEKQKRAIEAVTGQAENDPLADVYTSSGGFEVYPVKKDNQEIAKAIKTSSEKGYSGRIELILGVDTEGKILGIQVLDHRETPGLGSKISAEGFQQQFIGQNQSSLDYRVTKDGGQVDAISGATISSRAFAEAVYQALTDQK